MDKVPYISIVGSLMYVMVCIKVNISQAVWVVINFISNLGNENYEAVKFMLWYLKGTYEL